LVLHEGCRLRPYRDTEGNWTVLIGYNLSSRGWGFIEKTLGRRIGWQHSATPARPFGEPELTTADAVRVLGADIDRLELAIPVVYPEFVGLSEVRRRVVLDMAFNMGTKALGFRQAIAAAGAKDWSRCARELYKSRWARQVGDGEGGRFDRCDRLARMVLTDQPPADVPILTDGFSG
jgi:lysozyme